jgi:hypothetical protein
MDGLAAIVWNLITETNGAPAAVWIALREHIRTDPGILLDGWDDLTDLGSDAGWHAKEQIVEARQLVHDVLHAIGDAAGDRGRDLGPVARGLVVLMARQIAAYKQGRKATTARSPHGPARPRMARRGRRKGRGR